MPKKQIVEINLRAVDDLRYGYARGSGDLKPFCLSAKGFRSQTFAKFVRTV